MRDKQERRWKKTLELPLRITETKTPLLWGNDWMQRLGIKLHCRDENITTKVIKLEGKETPKAEEKISMTYFATTQKSKLFEGKNLKKRFVRTVLHGERARKLNKNGYLERGY